MEQTQQAERMEVDMDGEEYKLLEEAFGRRHPSPGVVYVILDTMRKEWSTRKELEVVLRWGLLQKNILELGCATGEFFPFFEEYGASIEGMDKNPSSVAEARKLGRRVQVGNVDCQFFSDTSWLANGQEKYDVIFSHNVWRTATWGLSINRTNTIRNFVENPVAYLKPNGLFIHYSSWEHLYDMTAILKGKESLNA